MIRRWVMLVLSVLLLAACESTPTRLFTYAAQGVEIQAGRLVGQFFGKDVAPLPYAGGNIDPPLQRMHARFPQLIPLFESGVLGLTEDGDVALRGSDATSELKKIVRVENRDRAILYAAMVDAVGHDYSAFVHYVDSTFGTEWQKQAPAGWWLLDGHGGWRQKT